MGSSFESVLGTVLAAPAVSLTFADEPPALAAHLQAMQGLTAHLEHACDRAFVAGHASDRIGTAFAAGYTEALRALVPEPDVVPGAFAMTEAGGGAPSAVRTTLQIEGDGSGTLQGEKTFVTLGDLAERIYVVASEGHDARGRNRLRLVRIRRGAAGLAWAPGPSLPIVPEVAHARLTLNQVHVPPFDVLDGDAYERYVKPFRTLEDIHVHAALLGHLLRVARHFQLAEVLVADLLGSFIGLRALSKEAPLAESTHLALGGVLRAFEHLLGAHAASFSTMPEGVARRLQRDLALRFVAAKAREKRLATAFRLGRGEN